MVDRASTPKDLFSDLTDAYREIDSHRRLIEEKTAKIKAASEKLLPLFSPVGTSAYVRPYSYSSELYKVTRRLDSLHIERITVLNMDELEMPKPDAGAEFGTWLNDIVKTHGGDVLTHFRAWATETGLTAPWAEWTAELLDQARADLEEWLASRAAAPACPACGSTSLETVTSGPYAKGFRCKVCEHSFTVRPNPDLVDHRADDCGGDVTVHPHPGDCECSVCRAEHELAAPGPVS